MSLEAFFAGFITGLELSLFAAASWALIVAIAAYIRNQPKRN